MSSRGHLTAVHGRSAFVNQVDFSPFGVLTKLNQASAEYLNSSVFNLMFVHIDYNTCHCHMGHLEGVDGSFRCITFLGYVLNQKHL